MLINSIWASTHAPCSPTGFASFFRTRSGPKGRVLLSEKTKEGELRELLRRAQRQHWGAHLRLTLVQLIALAAALGLWGLLLGLVSIELSLKGWLWWASLALGGAATLWRLMIALARSRKPIQVAKLLERGGAGCLGAVTSALQFATHGSPWGASAAMAQAHVNQTLRGLRQRCPLPQVSLAWWPQLALTGALLTLTLGALSGEARSGFGMLLGMGNEKGLSSTGQVEMATQHSVPQQEVFELYVEDLRAHLKAPEYTGIYPREVVATSGGIQVVEGTELTLTGRLISPAKSVDLVLKDEAGVEQVLPCKLEGSQLSLSFSALSSASMHFRIRVEEGLKDNGIRRQLTVKPDQVPRVELAAEQAPKQVSNKEAIAFRYTAEDDFGLRELRLKMAINGSELQSNGELLAKPESRIYSGRPSVQLESYGLEPGDQIAFWVEALDNDEVHGAKMGRSPSLQFQISSPALRHDGLIQEQQALLDELIQLLADYLESPIPEQINDAAIGPHLESLSAIDARRRQLMVRYLDLDKQLQRDPLLLRRDYELFQRLFEDLRQRHERASRALDRLKKAPSASALSTYKTLHRSPQLSQSEAAVLALDELIALEWLDAAQMTLNEIRATESRLKALIHNLKAAGDDPELKAEILKELARLERQMQQLKARLQRQRQHMPKEHLNLGEPSQEAADSDSQSLRSLIESGDLDGALDSLEQMTQGLEESISVQDEMPQNGLTNTRSKMDMEASQLMDKLNDLVASQQALIEKGQSLERAINQRGRESIAERIDPTLQAQQQRLETIAPLLDNPSMSLDDSARESIDRLKQSVELGERLVQLGDLEGIADLAERLEEESERARSRVRSSGFLIPKSDPASFAHRQAEKRLDRVQDYSEAMQDELSQLLHDAQGQARANEMQEMREMGKEQSELMERVSEVRQSLQENEELESMAEDLAPGMQRAQRAMDTASGKLDRTRLKPGLEDERRALRALHGLKKSLQKSLQKERMGEQRNQEQSRERVKIPVKDAFDQEALRRSLLNYMRAPGLEAYEALNRRYYEMLVE